MSSHIYQLKFNPDLSDRPGELIILFWFRRFFFFQFSHISS